jgi:fumarylacetoacetate (FAA) hydrolase
MKLASLREGGRDGTLIVVSRDLARAVRADDIAPTLQSALDDWSRASSPTRWSRSWSATSSPTT